MSDQILTEEELSSIAKSLGTFMPDRVVKIIKSHQALLSANAELSFKNQKLKNYLHTLHRKLFMQEDWDAVAQMEKDLEELK